MLLILIKNYSAAVPPNVSWCDRPKPSNVTSERSQRQRLGRVTCELAEGGSHHGSLTRILMRTLTKTSLPNFFSRKMLLGRGFKEQSPQENELRVPGSRNGQEHPLSRVPPPLTVSYAYRVARWSVFAVDSIRATQHCHLRLLHWGGGG